MKKSIKNSLPKGYTAKNITTEVVNGSIILKYELEQEFKRGDILKEANSTFMYSGKKDKNGFHMAICGLTDWGKFSNTEKSTIGWTDRPIRKANEAETFDFLKKVVDNKYRINEETFDLIPISEFKRGDIITWGKCYDKYILTGGRTIDGSLIAFGYVSSYGTTIKDNQHIYTVFVRKVTEAEKAEVYKQMRKDNLFYNTETQNIEAIKWKPVIGDRFWHVDVYCEVLLLRHLGYDFDYELINSNNYFKTKEEALKVAKEVKNIYAKNK